MAFACAPPAQLVAGEWTLRALSEQDWPLEAAMSRDPDVVRWTLYPPNMTEQASRERIQLRVQGVTDWAGVCYAVLSSSSVPIGTAGIWSSEEDSAEAEVFYALLPHGRHRGAATAATIALSTWGLSSGVSCLVLWTISGNIESEAVADRAGFVREGTAIRDQRGEAVPMTRWTRYSDSAATDKTT